MTIVSKDELPNIKFKIFVIYFIKQAKRSFVHVLKGYQIFLNIIVKDLMTLLKSEMLAIVIM